MEPNNVDTPLIPFPDRVDVPSTASPPPALVYAMQGMATLQRLALSGCSLDAAGRVARPTIEPREETDGNRREGEPSVVTLHGTCPLIDVRAP